MAQMEGADRKCGGPWRRKLHLYMSKQHNRSPLAMFTYSESGSCAVEHMFQNYSLSLNEPWRSAYLLWRAWLLAPDPLFAIWACADLCCAGLWLVSLALNSRAMGTYRRCGALGEEYTRERTHTPSAPAATRYDACVRAQVHSESNRAGAALHAHSIVGGDARDAFEVKVSERRRVPTCSPLCSRSRRRSCSRLDLCALRYVQLAGTLPTLVFARSLRPMQPRRSTRRLHVGMSWSERER